ncbi:MAG TPA: KUP/HAK/KT family potassium transporter [Steroidobacteraceae bacterium]|jgi:KUP system potassium uptake protein|nr:KUP/HAK/KT family potassium transporter [Steroidobacteraceae bacterium]
MTSTDTIRARPSHAGRGALAKLAALGIVFGDLGTSPLYTLHAIAHATGGHFTPEIALGTLSLILWTLLITVSGKYCLFAMKADNRGEGGILALMSLVGASGYSGRLRVLTIMGLLGAALIYGDGAITPAISVLSALEGLTVAAAPLQRFIMPAAVMVLVGLFAMQRYGTERIGRAFGPIMLLWFVVIAALGAAGIAHHPAVLAAIDPRHAIRFLAHAGTAGFLVLGAVFLCVTGGEALYADMGHFGKASIRSSWSTVVLPAVVLNYAGQTAWMLDKGTISGNPFFQLAPTWAIYPLVALATTATIIASQAIITGSFSMTRQAMQLGWLPDVAIRQTSDRIYGQIYVPVVNWLMMVATVGITIFFGTSTRLAGAYGTAVASTMLLTTCLLYTAMRKLWHWPLPTAVAVGGAFLLVDGIYFVANLYKIADGGWLPLSLAAAVLVLMITWRIGVNAIQEALERMPEAAALLLTQLQAGLIPRVEGTTVFLTRGPQKIPRLVLDHVHFAGALPRHVVVLSVIFAAVPRVEDQSRSTVEEVASGFWHVVLRFGFVEIPGLRSALAHIEGLPAALDLDNAVFVGARDLVVHKPGSRVLRRWRLWLFAFLCRNTVKVVDRFSLPPQNVVEIARQFEI